MIGVGRIPKLEPGEVVRSVGYNRPDPAGFPAEGARVLAEELAKAGLFENEATAVADLWREELFASPGLTVFFRIPQEEYERMVPMTLTPAAEKSVRVAFVRYSQCESDAAEKIEALIADLAAKDPVVRESAWRRLEESGRPALVRLARLRQRDGISPELAARVDQLLDRHQVSLLKPATAER